MESKSLVVVVVIVCLSTFGFAGSQFHDINSVAGVKPTEASASALSVRNVTNLGPWQQTNDTLTWEPPLEYQQKFPYYVAGYDFEKRPVVVVEFGKWDIRSMVERGPQEVQVLKKYISQFVNRMLLLKSPYPEAEEGTIAIFDAEGYNFRQLRHLPTAQFLIEQALYLNLLEPHAHRVIVINSNFVVEALINMVRNVGGRFFDKVESYGNDQSRWIPALLDIVPKSQLPIWYGGSKDFKPIQIFG